MSTSIDIDVAQAVVHLRETFDSGITKSLKWRRTQLLNLEKLLNEGKMQLCEALKKDLNKSHTEGLLTEVGFIANELQHHLDYLEEWMSPEKVGTDVLNLPGCSEIHKDPLGVACIIGAWNYPVQLSLLPLVGALAAGNTCLVKVPSDNYSNYSSRAIAELCSIYFDPKVVAVIQGDRTATTLVLEQRYDIIFFTGGSYVGKMVATAAAKHLTPTVLELGGKSPCIVDASANLEVAAKRTTWAAFMNAGQTCIRPDYVLVHTKVADKFIENVKRSLVQFYGKEPEKSEFFGRLINARAQKRVSLLIEDSKTFVIYGDESSKKDTKYIGPTIMDFGTDLEAFSKASVMKDEIFGPILPILRYNDLNTVIQFIREREKPLALYCFSTTSKTKQRIVTETTSGATCFNDCVMQMTNSELPFGGVGYSGMGSYHGKKSFDTFSHRKSVLYKTNWLDVPQRYPPYTTFSSALMLSLTSAKPRWKIRALKTIAFLVFLLFIRYYSPSSSTMKTYLFTLVTKFM